MDKRKAKAKKKRRAARKAAEKKAMDMCYEQFEELRRSHGVGKFKLSKEKLFRLHRQYTKQSIISAGVWCFTLAIYIMRHEFVLSDRAIWAWVSEIQSVIEEACTGDRDVLTFAGYLKDEGYDAEKFCPEYRARSLLEGEHGCEIDAIAENMPPIIAVALWCVHDALGISGRRLDRFGNALKLLLEDTLKRGSFEVYEAWVDEFAYFKIDKGGKVQMRSREADRKMAIKVTGERVREIRRKKGWKQKTLAAHVGVSPETMCKIERGVRGMQTNEFKMLCRLLNISADYLLGITDEPKAVLPKRRITTDGYKPIDENDKEKQQ